MPELAFTPILQANLFTPFGVSAAVGFYIMHGLMALGLVLVSAYLTSFMTRKLHGYLIKKAILDRPNERSSHKTPTPRGGGLAIMAVVLVGMAMLLIFCGASTEQGDFIPVLCGALFLSTLSYLDDKNGLPSLIRLIGHFAAAYLGTFALPPDWLLLGGLIPSWLDKCILIVGWVWFINLYNFMDGIDGLTGTETITLAIGFILIAILGQFFTNPAFSFKGPEIWCALLLLGTLLGFLRHNWPPAKIFMGDCGSVPLGFLTGYLLLSLAVKGYLAPALILPLYYLADSGLTIGRRILKGEKFWQPHRQHFYQKAALALQSHMAVIKYVALCNGGLIVATMVAIVWPFVGLSLGLLITAMLIFKLQKSSKTPNPVVRNDFSPF